MTWLDALGWGGSALLVYSLMQARVVRFRALNLVACLVLVVFNAVLGIWPMVAMNVVLAAINLWFLAKLLRERHDETKYVVLRVRATDTYLAHVLRVHAEDIAWFQPDFEGMRVGHQAFLVQNGDETVGVVVVQIRDDEAHVLLDFVTKRYRDFSPGEFVWRQSDLLSTLGVRRVVTSPKMVAAYYGKVGFQREGEAWVLELA